MNPESRYARHHLIEGWDQDRLKQGRVMVAGAGAIGNEVIKLLALLGVGQIFIVDFDTIELSNLTRTVLYRAGDIGRPKAEIAAERARDLNPDVEARALQGDLEFDVGLGVYRAMDVVIGCLDSLQARLALNRNCRRAGVPWLNGGIEATLAEVALYGSESSACFECAMTPAMWERRNRRYSCTGLRAEAPEAPMPTTAIVASLAAGYLVHEALSLLQRGEGRKEGLAFSQKIYLTLQPYSLGVYDLPVNPDCLAHDRWDPVEVLEASPHALTARALLDALSLPEGIVELGFDLLTALRCVRCGKTETVLRPVEICGEAITFCPVCRTDSREPLVISWLDAASEYAEAPLASLGIPEYQILALNGAGGRRFVQLSGVYR